jgi:hypothetical protein
MEVSMTPTARFPATAARAADPSRDERSMLLLERAMALVSLLAVALLALAR